VYEAASQTNLWVAWINGELQYLTTNNSYQTSSYYGYSLGYDNQLDSYFDGDIAEVLVFNRVLTADERSTVNGYLDVKYGLVMAAPVVPTNLVATAISSNQISLTWGFNLGTSSTVFQLARATTSNGVYAVVGTVADATSYVDNNLMAGTTYYYQVTAVNAAGTSRGVNVAWATTASAGASIPFNNLMLWLKADTGLVSQGTNHSVRTWFDESGNYSDASQPSVVNQPLYITNALNGLPVVRFNATNSYFNFPDFLNGVTGAEALVILKAVTNTPTVNQPLWQFGVENDIGREAYPAPDGSLADGFGATAVQAEGIPVQSLTQYHVYDVLSQNNLFVAWLNGVLQYQTVVNTVGFTGSPSLGYYTYVPDGWDEPLFENYFAGDIAEVLIFNHPLTDDERISANNYLNRKYNLTNWFSITIVTPTNNMAFANPANIALQAAIVDKYGVSQVQYFQGGISLGIVTNVPYSLVWSNVADGNYTLTAQATDHQGLVLNSIYTKIIVEDAPCITMIDPALSTLYVGPTNIALTAYASDDDGTVAQVRFYQGTNSLGISTREPYTIIWTNASTGIYALTAQATDNYGVISTSSVVYVTIDAPPSLSLNSPASNSYWITPTNMILAAVASNCDGTLPQVQFFQGDSCLGMVTNPPYSFVWSNVMPGNYTFTAWAKDDHGLAVSACSSNVMVAGIILTNPANNTVMTALANIQLGVTLLDKTGISQVQYFQGVNSLGTLTSSPYSLVWTNVGTGTYILIAQATDAGGLIFTSAPVNVVIDADPNSTDRDGDGVSDYLEYLTGRNSLVNGTVPDTNGVINLQIYTPSN
jgi:hypothetical protein